MAPNIYLLNVIIIKMANSITILNNTKQEITTIYHFADVHIKANISVDLCEHYIDMIDKCVASIKKDKNLSSSIICICGDIIDTIYSTECIKIIKIFFNRLAGLCPVVYTVGSHDLSNKRNLEISDMITPLIHDFFNSENEIYPILKEGLYQYNNVIFGLTKMGSLDVTTCAINKNTINKTNVKFTKIGLYHGQVSYPELEPIVKKQCDLDVSNFTKHYDYTFLGDRHTFSYLDKAKTVAYSGSLYEVNYREVGIPKGFIKWDIKNKSSKFIEIDSHIKHLIIKVTDAKIQNYVKAIAKKVKIKLIYNDDTPIDKLDGIETKLKKENNVIEYIVEKDFSNTYLNSSITIGNKKKNVDDIKSFDVVIKMIADHIKEHYDHSKKTMDTVDKYLKMMVKKVEFNFFEKASTFKLVKLQFDNINSYGPNNVVDFNLFNGKICEVSGPNGTGKSSILTVLLLGLYNECDVGTKYDCLNIKHVEKEAKIVVDFEVNGEKYQINKKIYVRSHIKRECHEDLLLFKNNKDITGQDNVETQKKIINLIGTYDNMIDTNIILQRGYKAFTDLSNNDKKKVIAKVSKLDVFDMLAKHVRSELASLQKRVPMLTKQIDELLSKESKESDKRVNFIDLQNEMTINTENLQDEITKLQNDKTKLDVKFNKCNKLRIELEFELKDHIITNTNTNKTKNAMTLKETKSKLAEVKEELNETDELLTTYKKELGKSQYKNYEKRRNEYDKKIKLDIDNFIKQKNKLLLDVTKIPNFDENKIKKNITKLKKQIDEYEDDIVNIENESNITTNYKKFTETTSQLVKVTEQITRLTTDIKKYKDKQKHVDDIEHNPNCKFCVKLKDKLTFEENIKMLQLELDSSNKSKENINKILKKLEDCEKKYNDYVKNVNSNKELSNEIKLCQKDLDNLQKELDMGIEVNKSNKKINKQIEEFDKNLSDLKTNKFEHSDKYDELQKKIEKAENDIDKKTKQIKELQLVLDNFENITKAKKLEEIKNEYVLLEKKCKTLGNDIIKKSKIVMENEIILRQVTKLKEELDQLKKEKQIVEYINKTLEKDGIQDTILINNVIPKLQQEINNLLNTLSNFNIEIKYLNKTLQVYKVLGKKDRILKLSGYEHMILGLCFRLVFCSLSQQKCKFVCFDEIFTFADDNGIQKIGQLFDYIRSRFDFALVISHNDNIKKFCDVSLNIEKLNGFSKICTNK